MATRKSQRIGIWVIAIVMTVGTIGSFFLMILQNDNAQQDQKKMQEEYAKYQKQMEEQQKQADELSTKHYASFKPYEAAPAAFDKNSVGDKVTTKDLKTGDGAEIKTETKYQAYYIGWNPDGKMFDSSFNSDKLKAPIDTSTTSLIEGWSQGVVGMKVGGVREITIPAKLAYGEQGSGEVIPPNTPIRFIVMIIGTK